MNATCQPLPKFIVEDMLQIAARALCDRPGDTAQQRESRTRQMVYSILGFEPRDGLEFMLATMIVGHFLMIMDSMRAVLLGQADSVKARTKTGIVSLDRAMLAFVRDLRLIRHRPVAGWAEDAQRQAQSTGPVETPEWVAPWAGVPPTDAAPPVAENVAAATAAEAPESPAATVPVPARPASTKATVASRGAPLPAREQTPGVAKPASHPAGVTTPSASPPDFTDDPETRRHMAEFEDALAALADSLAEARALDGERTEAKVAGGD